MMVIRVDALPPRHSGANEAVSGVAPRPAFERPPLKPIRGGLRQSPSDERLILFVGDLSVS
jgi:hypothetical protein